MNGNALIQTGFRVGLVLLVCATAPMLAQNAYYGGSGAQGYNGNQNYNGGYFVAPARVYMAPGWGTRGVSYVTVPTMTRQSQMIARNFFAGGGIPLATSARMGAMYPYVGGRVATVTPQKQPTPLQKSRLRLLAGRP